jgi:ABC-type branched-subunit amino acid transport system substrate-binding protein
VAPAEATKEPIVIGAVTTDQADGFSISDTADGLQAWVNYVNANGGIDGRPVELDRCNDEGTPEANQTCARGLADNADVVAVAGSTSPLNGSVGLPILAETGIPYVCASPLDAPEASLETSFCTSGGVLTGYVQLVEYLLGEGGHDHLVFLGSENPNAVRLAGLLETVAEGVGGTVEYVPVPLGAPDFTPSLTQAMSSDPGAIILGLDAASMIRALEAADTLGITTPFAALGATVNQSVLDSGAASLEGMILNVDFPVFDESDPEVAIFRTQMDEDGKTDAVSVFSLSGWVSGRALEAAIREVGADNVTRESILEVFNGPGVSDVPLLPEETSLANAPAVPGFERLANGTTFIAEVQDGVPVVVTDRIESKFFAAG